MADYTLPDLPYDYGAPSRHLRRDPGAPPRQAPRRLRRQAPTRLSRSWPIHARRVSSVPSSGLEKTLAFNLSGHVLHSIFWTNLSPDGGDKPDGDLSSAIDEHFGSFDAFKAQMTQATTTVQGSGWGVLAWEPLGGRLLIEQAYDHQGNIGQGAVPLLVFDAWEHAFYLQYKNVKADYAAALWNIVNWPDVAARLQKARSLKLT